MNQQEFEILIDDQNKVIDGNIDWLEDEDHSPSLEFRAEISSNAGYPVFVRGSYNPLIPALSYTIIHRSSGRIYALDMGKKHHNPSCQDVGEVHKHRWDEPVRDKNAYEPADITMPANDPIGVWIEFCAEAKIIHNGVMHLPPPLQLGMFV